MSENQKPKFRPYATRDEVREWISNYNVQDNAFLVGVRGYYKKTFGNPEANDRIFFDDALFVISDNDGIFHSFNFNSDPSILYRKGLATLKANEVYEVVKHKHKGKYNALQIVSDKIIRDGFTEIEIGRHGINFHFDHEWYSRDSLGCQTLPRSQWDSFIESVYAIMTKHQMANIKYIFVEN